MKRERGGDPGNSGETRTAALPGQCAEATGGRKSNLLNVFSAGRTVTASNPTSARGTQINTLLWLEIAPLELIVEINKKERLLMFFDWG